MSDLSPINDVLEALHTAFGRGSMRWYLFGGQAAVLWGRPRFTEDVDVTVQVSSDNMSALLELLRKSGIELRIHEDIEEFVAVARVFPLVHVASETRIDLILAGPGLEERFLERAVTVTVGGVGIPVISPEDLIVTKVLSGRPIDVEDVRGILIERGEALDMDLIRNTLHELEQALGQSELIPLFDAERKRAMG